MDDIVGLLVVVAVIISMIVSVIRRVARQLTQTLREKPWESLTPVERSVQRELEKYIRGKADDGGERPAAPAPAETPGPMERTLADRRAAPPSVPPPTVSVRQTIPTTRKKASATRQEHNPHLARSGAAPASPLAGPAGPRRRKLRLNQRTMGRVAILSEIWRLPLALREGNPWDRS